MEELKVDKKALLEECGNLDDASTQMVLGEGEEIQLLLGEALVLVDEDYAMEYCSKKQVGFIIQFMFQFLCVVGVTVRMYAEVVLTL